MEGEDGGWLDRGCFFRSCSSRKWEKDHRYFESGPEGVAVDKLKKTADPNSLHLFFFFWDQSPAKLCL
jgi:hypothetical protein